VFSRAVINGAIVCVMVLLLSHINPCTSYHPVGCPVQ
jgi:hypothetical protein